MLNWYQIQTTEVITFESVLNKFGWQCDCLSAWPSTSTFFVFAFHCHPDVVSMRFKSLTRTLIAITFNWQGREIMYFVETIEAIFALCTTTISVLYYVCASVACPHWMTPSFMKLTRRQWRERKNYFNFHDEFMRNHKKYSVVVVVVRKQFMIGV